MVEFINQIDISNFKSIQTAKIRNCKRINLFIGRPNVGKSNILEALSLFTVPYLYYYKSRNLNSLVRCESLSELFYSGQNEASTYVETNLGSVQLLLDKIEGLDLKFMFPGHGVLDHYYFDDRLQMRKNKKAPAVLPSIKKYTFATRFDDPHLRIYSLLPPYGDNLYRMVELNDELKTEIETLFREYQLELTFDRASQTLKVLKRNKESIFLIPYQSIADTLQRIIFYKTAIASNKDSVLLFEEPEAHSFPPYITQITQEMIFHRTNQYFVATHSPFILNDLLENARNELSVYLVDYKNQETKIKHLNDTTLHDIYQSGVDLFTNWETFA